MRNLTDFRKTVETGVDPRLTVVRLKGLLFEETLTRVLRACKKNFLFYWRNRCSTGRSCSKADQRLTRVSFSFVKKHFFG